jgi:hypothetical protein
MFEADSDAALALAERVVAAFDQAPPPVNAAEELERIGDLENFLVWVRTRQHEEIVRFIAAVGAARRRAQP